MLENDDWFVCSVLAERSWVLQPLKAERDDCVLAIRGKIARISISKLIKNIKRLSSRKLGMCQKRKSL
jgi:hypothetical protein